MILLQRRQIIIILQRRQTYPNTTIINIIKIIRLQQHLSVRAKNINYHHKVSNQQSFTKILTSNNYHHQYAQPMFHLISNHKHKDIYPLVSLIRILLRR